MPRIALWTSLLICLPAPVVWAQAVPPTSMIGWVPVTIAALVPTIGLVAFAVRADERSKRHELALVEVETRVTRRIEDVYTRTGEQIAQVAALVRDHISTDHAPHGADVFTRREAEEARRTADAEHKALRAEMRT